MYVPFPIISISLTLCFVQKKKKKRKMPKISKLKNPRWTFLPHSDTRTRSTVHTLHSKQRIKCKSKYQVFRKAKRRWSGAGITSDIFEAYFEQGEYSSDARKKGKRKERFEEIWRGNLRSTNQQRSIQRSRRKVKANPVLSSDRMEQADRRSI